MLTMSAADFSALPSAPGLTSPSAMIPPVDVPVTRSKRSLMGRFVRTSISARTRAGIIPRIPPPSTASTLNAGAIVPPFPRRGDRRRTVACPAGEYPPAYFQLQGERMPTGLSLSLRKLLALLALVAFLAAAVVPAVNARNSRAGGPGYGWPPSDTGNRLLDWLSDFLTSLVHIERRFDPFFRPAFEATLQGPLTT